MDNIEFTSKFPHEEQALQAIIPSLENLKLIDCGHEAQVYHARIEGDRKVAIKLFFQQIPRDRIYEERDYLKSVASPYVLKLFDNTVHKWSDGRFFIVTNLVSGDSLRVEINNGLRPSLEDFRHVASCLLQAVEAMHKDQARENALLHNDIKPDNILLSESLDPVLIDFGTVCHPKISSYRGTDFYTAPDLLGKVDFEFCESGDLFALAISLFEWFCGVRPYTGVPKICDKPKFVNDFRKDDLPDKFIEWFNLGVQPTREKRFNDIFSMKEAFENIWKDKENDLSLPVPDTPEVTGADSLERNAGLGVNDEESILTESKNHENNPFVRYLNSLHNVTAEDENSLAESQALSVFFGPIHISLAQTQYIFDQLTHSEGRHVILTGHAGDGKSVIGLELYKKLRGIPLSTKLSTPLKDHEKVEFGNYKIHIIKDMSELGAGERAQILSQAVATDNYLDRWLIISNTGTLLSTFEEIAKDKNELPLSVENTLLENLGKKDPSEFSLFETKFTLINIALTDNIDTGMSVFKNILNHEAWSGCSDCALSGSCFIKMNINILKDNEIAFQGISAIYRRLKDYGHRLTMRQLTGHLAYSLTGGIGCREIYLQTISANPPLPFDYLFSNLFFGHNGMVFDDEANRLSAIQAIANLEMGSRPFPEIDKDLWRTRNEFWLQLPSYLQPMVQQLQGGLSYSNNARKTRQAIRRAYYMFAQFDKRNCAMTSFLDSQMLMAIEKWQQSGKPSLMETSELLRKILHVLQEEFTGFKLGANVNDGSLYITLRRRQEGYRQNVQLLLAEIPRSSFSLEWRQTNKQFEPFGHILLLKAKYIPAEMKLDLPFLDFVLMRDAGEVGQRLNPGYRDRIEKFKSDLMKDTNNNADQDHKLKLIELDSSGHFNTRTLVIDNKQLQVM